MMDTPRQEQPSVVPVEAKQAGEIRARWVWVEAAVWTERSADDFVVLCHSREEAESALSLIQQWVSAAGLMLQPEKTRIVDATQPGGFDFPGHHFEQGLKTPRPKSLQKFKNAIREQTPRTPLYCRRCAALG